MKISISTLSAALVATLPAGITAAHAQGNAPSPSAEESANEIIVTALKREQNLQDVPASVTVLSIDVLSKLSASDFSKVADSVPGVAYATTGLGNSQYIIRGVGAVGVAQSPLTGVYLDETPVISRALRGASQPDPQLFDVARVEVLRGPQGVLFGSSAMGGLVRIVTNQPDTKEFSGKVEGSVATIKDGSENWDVKAVVNAPLVKDVLALRLVGSYVRQGGWIDDLRPTTADVFENINTPSKIHKDANSTTYKTVRASLLWKPTDNLTVTPSILYQDGFSNTDRTFSDITFGLRARQKARYIDTFSKDKFVIGNLLIKNDFDALGGATLISSSSYMDRKTHLFFDVTAFYSSLVAVDIGPGPGGALYPVPLQDISHTKQFIQEVRLVSNNDSPLQYVMGGFYRHMNQYFNRHVSVANTFGVTPSLPLGTANPPVISDVQTPFKESEVAGFGEFTYAVTDQFKVAAGARVFSYKQRETSSRYGLGGRAVPSALAYAYSQRNKESSVTPRFTLSYEPSRAASFYASYSQGFRTGGVNAPITDDVCSPAERQVAGLPGSPPPYKSDKTNNYEVGAKTNFFGGKLRINAAAYSIQWKDFQQAFQYANGTCIVSFIVNAGKVRSQGGELEVTINPVRGLNLQAGTSYTDATYRNAVPQLLLPSGSRVLDVPKFNWNARADYGFPITDSLNANLFFSARHIGGTDSGFGEGEVLHRLAYTLLDMSIGIETASELKIELFINNITDEIPVFGAEFATSPDDTTATSYFSYHVGPPRTVGVRVSKAF